MISEATEEHPYAAETMRKHIDELIELHLSQITDQETNAAALSVKAGEYHKHGQELEMVYSNLQEQYQSAKDKLDSNDTLEVFLIILMTVIIIAAAVGMYHLYQKKKEEHDVANRTAKFNEVLNSDSQQSADESVDIEDQKKKMAELNKAQENA